MPMVCDLQILYGLLNILPVVHGLESHLEHPLSPQHFVLELFLLS